MQNYNRIVTLLFLALTAHDSCANAVAIPNDRYKAVLEISATGYRKRSIGEIDLMMPMWQSHNNLGILDIKFKKDRKSYEYNLGLVYRHNFDDRWIFGIYSYFDRRRTEHKLEANQWTFGTEALSNFFDVRFNAYLPENKKRTIYTKPREFRRDHTAIYALSEGKFQEHTLPGYDIEVGTHLFGLFPTIDDKFGTKIYVAKYDFTRKHVAKNSGLRFRLEQKLFEDKLGNSPFRLTMHVGTHYTNRKKWDNFVGLSIRVPLSKDHPRRTKMQERMMDTVVRDVDIRTEKRIGQPREPLHLKGKQIDNVYFVAEGSCGGNGSSSNPYCIAEYQDKLKNTKPGFMIIPIGHFTENGYNAVMDHPDAIDHVTHDVVLATTDSGATFSVKGYFPELRLIKSQDEEVHTYSAVRSIHTSEQTVPEKHERGNEDLYYSYMQEDVSPEYTYKTKPESLYETSKVSSQSEQRAQKPVVTENLVRTKEEETTLIERQRLIDAEKRSAQEALAKQQQPMKRRSPLVALTPNAQTLNNAFDQGKESASTGAYIPGATCAHGIPAPQKPHSTEARKVEEIFNAGKAEAAAVDGFIPAQDSDRGVSEERAPQSAEAIRLEQIFKAGKESANTKGFPRNR